LVISSPLKTQEQITISAKLIDEFQQIAGQLVLNLTSSFKFTHFDFQ
jgi:hypothetical protein